MPTVRANVVRAAVVIAAASAVYWLSYPQPPRDFDAWVRAEQSDMAWVQALPPVYSRLAPGNRNPEPENCEPRMWPTLRRIANQYHPGAVYEMRSAPLADSSGHQATYDANGNLIRQGLAAGSADRASPGSGWNPIRALAHRDRDVIPFVLAAQLDGNAVRPGFLYLDLDSPIRKTGEHLRAYAKVRPTQVERELAPGVCAATSSP